MDNNNTLPVFKKLRKQSFTWIASVASLDYRHPPYRFKAGDFIYRFFLSLISWQTVFLSHVTRVANLPALKVDKAIYGNNPVLNLLILKKLAQQAHEQQKKWSVLVVQPNMEDYWGYHCSRQQSSWQKVHATIYSEVDFFNQTIKEMSESNLNIIWLASEDYQLSEFKRESLYSGQIMCLKKCSVSQQSHFASQMPTVLKTENQIRQEIWQSIKQSWIKHFKKINLLVLPQYNDKGTEFFVLSENIYLTHNPATGLNTQVMENEQAIVFQHEYSDNAFGSAKKMVKSFDFLEEQFVQDIRELM